MSYISSMLCVTIATRQKNRMNTIRGVVEEGNSIFTAMCFIQFNYDIESENEREKNRHNVIEVYKIPKQTKNKQNNDFYNGYRNE